MGEFKVRLKANKPSLDSRRKVAVIVIQKMKKRGPYRQLRSCLDPRHKDKQKARKEIDLDYHCRRKTHS